MAVWLLSACSSQKKGDGEDVQVLMKDSVDANGLQRMQVSDSKMSFTYNGRSITLMWFVVRMTVCLL